MRSGILKHAFDSGMLILGSGTNAIRMRPPLVAGKAEIDQAVDTIAQGARKIAGSRPTVAV